jgi:hypothetical protein
MCVLQAKKKDLKSVTAYPRGSGESSTIRASYIVEAPVWKATYRLFFNTNHRSCRRTTGPDDIDDDGEAEQQRPKSIIEGWALVDNTQNEDWRGVELSLVSGASNSFIYDLYNPRYAARTEARAPPPAPLYRVPWRASLFGLRRVGDWGAGDDADRGGAGGDHGAAHARGRHRAAQRVGSDRCEGYARPAYVHFLWRTRHTTHAYTTHESTTHDTRHTHTCAHTQFLTFDRVQSPGKRTPVVRAHAHAQPVKAKKRKTNKRTTRHHRRWWAVGAQSDRLD